MSSLSDVFWSAPPVARTLTALTALETFAMRLGLLDFKYVFFHPYLIFKKWPEIWRLFTPFLLASSGVQMLMDLYFLYIYGSRLEKESPRFSTPGSFFIYVLFVGTVVLILAGGILGNIVFASALWMAFIYTWSQDNIGTPVTIYFIQIRAEYLPLALTFVTWLGGGTTQALVEITGIMAAHMYDYLTRLYPTFGGGRNYIQTPLFVQRWFQSRGPQATGYGAYRMNTPGGRTAGSTSFVRRSTGSSSTSFFSGNGSWRNRGAGRRLGGDE
ncbi:hypothetical protein KEM54_002981 [Ascosphaera aggregata]|nr:hypothetical protein KEM54_002981 [Ascosphaera aggregata]